jgi:16S rRNA (adenine1518-N6/adenine1519-N6)-dimethyltransferase
LPRKLGQHFLVSQPILEKIAEAACGAHAERVVEIGPGRGALTRHLLRRCDELHAIELDDELAPALNAEFGDKPGFALTQGDVLKADLSQWGPAIIVGNLPYYITSPIIDLFLNLDERFPTAVFLMQREVADRLLAKPHTRDYGYLTVKTQLLCDVKIVVKVPPGAFGPPPKVDSAAVRFDRKQGVASNAELMTFVSRCFAQKRKTLRNNLKAFYPLAVLEALPEAGLRAEQIAVEEFRVLLEKLRMGTAS